MEHTFMTIHNLTPDGNILFASESITEILGYQPEEVQNKSCFDFFHPQEVPFARFIHSRGILLDKAAVLNYARIRSRDGRWISCECCFTVVHDVLVASTSIYRHGEKSERRAIEAPQIRRLFSSRPRDPRYHMLEHLSPKFEMPPLHREPRAALILNRFTRSLCIMFSTNAIVSILGLSSEDLQDKSFYDCIQESCLRDAVHCLESAKANDSIAYLRFWFRDPRSEQDLQNGNVDAHHDGTDGTNSSNDDWRDSRLSDSDSGGVPLADDMELDTETPQDPVVKVEEDEHTGGLADGPSQNHPPYSSGSSNPNARSNSSMNTSSSRSRGEPSRPASGTRRRTFPLPPVELEAVVSCTSDGLVVVLRKARELPQPVQNRPASHTTSRGLFAAPWAQRPIYPEHSQSPYSASQHSHAQYTEPFRNETRSSDTQPADMLMGSIREIAVFAWALTGINGNMASYSSGHPAGEAQPFSGLPIWDPQGGHTHYHGPENQAAQRWAAYGQDGISFNYRNHQHETNYARPLDGNYQAYGTHSGYTPRSYQQSWPLPQQQPATHPFIPSPHPEMQGYQGMPPPQVRLGGDLVFQYHQADHPEFSDQPEPRV
ncbi:hypothetical protein S7711_00708 [Stachybotrys chartarum IBT 7711]|uniref:PAS domain-containing protein n=1 Tax=Stachybotrys chartarum (strain CBS 109288 / IBT 7711) TaxID=1280523 RepID=A0A084AZY3_STACB|nr:hypothetical protein S7711_00708 [Stachybotrys chartarum IBT 7711]KFA73612.1 hypothetical protein S40288_02598 [Stachybotrys chartarum IBT 40288]